MASFKMDESISRNIAQLISDFLLLNLVKSRSREIGCYNDYIALKFDGNLGSAATEVLANFQSSW